jgi:hypothetical protein
MLVFLLQEYISSQRCSLQKYLLQNSQKFVKRFLRHMKIIKILFVVFSQIIVHRIEQAFV